MTIWRKLSIGVLLENLYRITKEKVWKIQKARELFKLGGSHSEQGDLVKIAPRSHSS